MHGREIGPFIHIFTSDDVKAPGASSLVPAGFVPPSDKQHYLVLMLKGATEFEEVKTSGLLRLGRLEVVKKQKMIIISEDALTQKPDAIISAIHALEKTYPPQTPAEQAHYESLRQFQQKFVAQKEQEPPRKTPPKSRPSSRYTPSDDQKEVAKSANATEVLAKRTKRDAVSDKRAVHKKTSLPIADIELFNALCFKVPLADQHPTVRGLHDETSKKRLGTVSEKGSYTPFLELKEDDNYSQHGLITRETLLAAHVAYLLVAAYFHSENDLHAGNYGLDKQTGLSIKIDDDQASWEISSEFASYLSPKYPAPANAFPITERDILQFPQLVDAVPYHWIDRGVFDEKGQPVVLPVFDIFSKPTQVVDKEKNIFGIDPAFIRNKEFNRQKYTMFLKLILIPNDVYRAIGDAAFGDDEAKRRDLMVQLKIDRTQKLKQTLLKMPEFRDFIRDNPKAIRDIIHEFDDYNDSCKKEEDAKLRVDIDKVRAIYHQEIIPILSKVADRKPASAPSSPALLPKELKPSATSSLPNFGIFASEQKKQSIDDVMLRICSVLPFLVEPAQNKIAFVAWTKQLSKEDQKDYLVYAKKLNAALASIDFGPTRFKNALLSLITNNDDQPMRALVTKHPTLITELTSLLQNPIITKWYDDKFPSKAPSPSSDSPTRVLK